MRERWLGEVQLHAVLLLVLLTTASCWGFGRQKDALTSKAKHAQHKLPSSTFVRIFALPSFEADVAQVLHLTQCHVAWKARPMLFIRAFHSGEMQAR